MKLTSFRIQNFRSIVDTKWQNLSPDNITCLIGQNESGKTSVLEGLLAFYRGEISEDVLRSDLSLPSVSCRFEIPPGWLKKNAGRKVYGLEKLLEEEKGLELERFWQADFSSVVRVGGSIGEAMDQRTRGWEEQMTGREQVLLEKTRILEVLETECRELENKKISLDEALTESRRRQKNQRGGMFRKKKTEEQDSSQKAGELKKQLSILEKEYQQKKDALDEFRGVKEALKQWKTLMEDCSVWNEKIKRLLYQLEERHQSLTLMMQPEEWQEDQSKWDQVLKDYRSSVMESEEAKRRCSMQTLLCEALVQGVSPAQAREKAESEMKSFTGRVTPEQLGDQYFSRCPVFEMFEDFGSLLPNRIDLEDIISNNQKVEGYKAARNFLTIARLDYNFFQQPSNRILKQKIENLNNDLTENFQDFWQQCIHTRNKIRIQFELDHYDASRGEKSGKPYLEFWIKDQGERLYPKQRSRGVRWFLSFYLEMKASAIKDEHHKVLLVDEPGVSLHARAQEDVLRVFEDVRERLQILYTTHSPHLVDIHKIHRVLAVQRNDIMRSNSATVIIEPTQLAEASPDTLSPIQSVMGNPVEGFSVKKNNLIVNDIGTFYLLHAALLLAPVRKQVHFMPSTETDSIPLMCNIMMGWGVGFRVLLFGNDREKNLAGELKKTLFTAGAGEEELILQMPAEYENAEDLFSTLDFKKLIVKTREGIPIANSRYVQERELPREFLFSSFLNQVKSGKITPQQLDEETRENLKFFSDQLKTVL